MFSYKYKRGVAWWVVVIIIAVVIAAGLIAEEAADDDNEDTTQNDNQTQLCPSYCLLFAELECGSNKLVGGCFGVWDCDDGVANPCQ